MGIINSKKPNTLYRIGGTMPQGTKTITANGLYDVARYEKARVNVPQPWGSINISRNGDINVTDYATAHVNVPQGVFPSGTKTITENGTFDVTEFVSADVNVPTGVTPTGTKTITTNGTYDVVNFANADVNVPQGVFPSGDLTITENGTYDVTNYVNAVVNTPVFDVVDFVGTGGSTILLTHKHGWFNTVYIYPLIIDWSTIDTKNLFVSASTSSVGEYTTSGTTLYFDYIDNTLMGVKWNVVNSMTMDDIRLDANFGRFKSDVTYRLLMIR